MNKRVLVLGRRGLLGSMVMRVLSFHSSFKIFGMTRDSTDPFHFDVENGLGRVDTTNNVIY